MSQTVHAFVSIALKAGVWKVYTEGVQSDYQQISRKHVGSEWQESYLGPAWKGRK